MVARILINGANGQLGKELRSIQHAFPDFEFYFLSKTEWNIADDHQSVCAIKSIQPNFLIHTAAYTKVDDAEHDMARCMELNAYASGRIAHICQEYKVRMIYLSSDYVFHQHESHLIPESQTKNPVGIYAKSKSLGEDLVLQSGAECLIIRTSWLYSSAGNNFVKTMLRLSKSMHSIRVVNDQLGSPTYARDLAETILHLITKWQSQSLLPEYPVFHFSNSGICSWYDFAKEIFQIAQIDVCVLPISTQEFGAKAPRPPFSGLDCSKIENFLDMPCDSWRSGLHRCLDQLLKFSKEEL